MESNKETRKRLTAVLNALKKEGHTQAKIADELGINADNISSYKIGKTKEIPDAFLDGLQEKYFINPGYIRGTSELMYDMQGFRLRTKSGTMAIAIKYRKILRRYVGTFRFPIIEPLLKNHKSTSNHTKVYHDNVILDSVLFMFFTGV